MSYSILDEALSAAVAAAPANQTAKRAATLQPWAGGAPVVLRYYSPAGVFLCEATHSSTWELGSGNPRTARPGALTAYMPAGSGLPAAAAYVEICVGATAYIRADVTLTSPGGGPVRSDSRTNLGSGSGGAGLLLSMDPGLPLDALPTWLPAPGGATTLTVANGRLANNFRDAATPWFGPFYHIKTCNDFSTSVVNPHFGVNGMVVFFGGGHSGTNDNTVTGLQIGDVCTFKNLVPGTPYEGTGTDSVTRDENGAGNQNDQLNFDTAVNTVDNKPGSPHSYGALDVIGPANGGASEGSLSLVIIPAVNRTNDGGSASSWKVDFPDTTSTLYAWQRRGTDFVALMNPITGGNSGGASWAAPIWTQFVPAQNRTYIECNGNHSPRWFDHGTNQYVLSNTATARPRNPDNPNSGTMFLVPERNLLIFAERSSGVVRLLWKDVSVGQEAGGWNASAATLSASIPVPSTWSAACWCADNGRILVGMQTAANPAENAQFTTTAVIEIEIPATLSNTWQVTEAPLSSGSIQWFNTPNIWKKWSYNPSAKGITWLQFATEASGDLVQHYRPRGT